MSYREDIDWYHTFKARELILPDLKLEVEHYAQLDPDAEDFIDEYNDFVEYLTSLNKELAETNRFVIIRDRILDPNIEPEVSFNYVKFTYVDEDDFICLDVAPLKDSIFNLDTFIDDNQILINGSQTGKLEFEFIDKRKIPLADKLQELKEMIIKYGDSNINISNSEVKYHVKSNYPASKNLIDIINLALHLKNNYLLVSTEDLRIISAI